MNRFITGHEYNKWQALGVNNTTLNVQGSYLYRYAYMDFLTKLYAVFDVDNKPESIDKRLLFNSVFNDGVAVIYDDEKYGLIAQPCTFRDHNINYQPVYAMVNNPYMRGRVTTELKIGVDCELIYFDLNYNSIYAWIDYFATLKAQYNGAFINQARVLNNPYIFLCDDTKIAKSFRKLADEVSDGEPFVFGDKNLFDMDGKLKMEVFNKDFSKNMIADKLYTLIEEIEYAFMEFIGVPRMYFKKKERMTSDEVNKNDKNTSLIRDYFLDTLNECCDRVNIMFNTDMKFSVSENIKDGEKDVI